MSEETKTIEQLRDEAYQVANILLGDPNIYSSDFVETLVDAIYRGDKELVTKLLTKEP